MKKYLSIITLSLISNFCHAEDDTNEHLKNIQNVFTKTYDRIVDKTSDYLNKPKVETNNFTEIWKKSYPNLEELLKLKEEQDDLPNSSWFRRDKIDSQNEINKLLEQSIEILGISDTRKNIIAINNIEENIAKIHTKIANLRTKKIGEPENSNKYDDEIVILKQKIAQYNQEIDSKKIEISKQMQSIGINISNEQLKLLMANVIGEDMLKMSIVFNNVKEISNSLSKLMQENGEDLVFARKHYGMYTTLLEILMKMQEVFILDVKNNYIPKIAKINEETKILLNETKDILALQTNEMRRQDLQTSIDAQNLTLNTAKLYKLRLHEQADQILTAYNELKKDFAIAMIRYKTVKISGDLASMIQNSSNQFSTLINLQLPNLIPFENLQMKSEFEKLTRELKK
jgi:hypothetical protein